VNDLTSIISVDKTTLEKVIIVMTILPGSAFMGREMPRRICNVHGTYCFTFWKGKVKMFSHLLLTATIWAD